jgi:C_GCAxxG_C_C family probable redox protein
MKETLNKPIPTESVQESVERSLSLSRNCAQAAFRCLERRWDLEPSGLPKALSFYPCGTLFLGGTCGAALGCMMAMGLALGKEDSDSDHDAGETARLLEAFCRRLVKQRGGITCRDILKFDPSLDPSGAPRSASGKKRSLSHLQRCAPTIAESVKIALELLANR